MITFNWSIVRSLAQGFLAGIIIVVVLVLVGMFGLSRQPAPAHNPAIVVMANELHHRTVVCDNLIDQLSPDNIEEPAFQCSMMVEQTERLYAYMRHYNITDKQGVLAVIAATSTEYRFMDYMTGLAKIQHNPNN